MCSMTDIHIRICTEHSAIIQLLYSYQWTYIINCLLFDLACFSMGDSVGWIVGDNAFVAVICASLGIVFPAHVSLGMCVSLHTYH